MATKKWEIEVNEWLLAGNPVYDFDRKHTTLKGTPVSEIKLVDKPAEFDTLIKPPNDAQAVNNGANIEEIWVDAAHQRTVAKETIKAACFWGNGVVKPWRYVVQHGCNAGDHPQYDGLVNTSPTEWKMRQWAPESLIPFAARRVQTTSLYTLLGITPGDLVALGKKPIQDIKEALRTMNGDFALTPHFSDTRYTPGYIGCSFDLEDAHTFRSPTDAGATYRDELLGRTKLFLAHLEDSADVGWDEYCEVLGYYDLVPYGKANANLLAEQGEDMDTDYWQLEFGNKVFEYALEISKKKLKLSPTFYPDYDELVFGHDEMYGKILWNFRNLRRVAPGHPIMPYIGVINGTSGSGAERYWRFMPVTTKMIESHVWAIYILGAMGHILWVGANASGTIAENYIDSSQKITFTTVENLVVGEAWPTPLIADPNVNGVTIVSIAPTTITVDEIRFDGEPVNQHVLDKQTFIDSIRLPGDALKDYCRVFNQVNQLENFMLTGTSCYDLDVDTNVPLPKEVFDKQKASVIWTRQSNANYDYYLIQGFDPVIGSSRDVVLPRFGGTKYTLTVQTEYQPEIMMVRVKR